MAKAVESKKKIEKSKKEVLKTSKTKAVSKPVVSKKAEVKVSKPAVKAAVKESKTTKTSDKNLSVKAHVFGVNGASKGSLTLPSEIFGATPNKALIAQAVRVYLANQRTGTASTKTRSEVIGSTRKIYRQKGTGRARHGALKAPIFVGGGVAHGPKPHSFSLEMPKKMRSKALISALSQRAQEGAIMVVDGEFSGKTKEVGKMLKAMDLTKKGKNARTLFVIDGNSNASRASKNIGNLEIESASTLSTYMVVANKNVIFMKNSVDKIAERLKNN